MSYCRFGKDSDVYMYADSLTGSITCCACQLNPISDGLWFGSQTFDHIGALAHLQEHIEAGHLVPEYAIKRLKKEIKRNKPLHISGMWQKVGFKP